MPQPDVKTIPAKACQFAADLQVGEAGDGKNVPITLVARSGDAVDNWWWGRIVHDLSGMTVPKPSIPLDYCHYEDQVLGFANEFDVASGSLVAKGELVPYAADPADRATEVIYKNRQGVPYEASIYFDGPLSIEEVGEGASVEVNGQQLAGPVTVVRQWTLRGIAVCPYGNDPNTSAAMKFGRTGDIQARVISKEPNNMATSASPKKLSEQSGATATEEKPAESATETTTEATAEKPTETPEAPELPKTEENPTQQSATPAGANVLTEGQRFLNAFGAQGGVWYAEGKTFAEAEQLHKQALTAERDKLAKENTELKKQLGATRGEETPVSAGGGKPTHAENTRNLTPGLNKFASSIKLPGRAEPSRN